MRGITLAEAGHIVNLIPPIDFSGGKSADIFSMKNWAHATIILQFGVSAAAITSIKVNACDDASGTNRTAIPFAVYKEETAAGDTLGPRVAATAASGVTPTANDNSMYVIEIDAADLLEGKPWVELVCANGVNAVLASAVAILTGGRYAGPESPTAIA